MAAAAGIPVPFNQIAAVPIVAGLKAKGLPVDTDVAVLLAGSVTSVPAIVVLSSIFRPRVVAFFVAVGFGGSVFLDLLRMALGAWVRGRSAPRPQPQQVVLSSSPTSPL